MKTLLRLRIETTNWNICLTCMECQLSRGSYASLILSWKAPTSSTLNFHNLTQCAPPGQWLIVIQCLKTRVQVKRRIDSLEATQVLHKRRLVKNCVPGKCVKNWSSLVLVALLSSLCSSGDLNSSVLPAGRMVLWPCPAALAAAGHVLAACCRSYLSG